ncbi:biotin carboxylase N-terminal domain-containing protein [Xanthobacter sp. KR7-65]|uniref:acetyl/propionyl/methylcrotonyl-CoA carboxylase subunit alpha n=1 Tax=Xanthobacter sp. KR7-65 TaxID=3156612 RepID=UPI0032B510AA
MFESVLIANRGEIAVRIMRTCRRLGIRTIAVYSDADRDACHVRAADEAVRIGPPAARDSYLDLGAIMAAARRTGAEAIHPGYGFLSEKPELAAACAAAGIAFVGPSAQAIAAMGPKIGSKRLAAQAGVPSVPGYMGDDQSDARLAAEALKIGLPVMVKASAGGGGKGMRRVTSEAELPVAIQLARREAEAAFGDPSLLIEKLVQRPRHLEVQVAGDRHGAVVHLFERDCSIQRNNQKLVEEAPAPSLDPAVREKLLTRGVALARAIGYDNLGTVEFILEDGQDEPWFLEMNTRLQVEHPVTEFITGLDLVEWQLRIAAGEPLPLAQEAITATGHAIEARVTTERVDQGFRPDIGPILAYREPAGVRVDSGVAAGSAVTQFYDSMVAKVIASGRDRDAARTRLSSALRRFALMGPATTLEFVADCLDHPIFAEGRATTRFIDEAFPEGWQPAAGDVRLASAIAALLVSLDGAAPAAADAWGRLAGFRLLAPAGVAAEAHFRVGAPGGEMAEVSLVHLADGRARVRDAEGEMTLAIRRDGDELEVEADGEVFHAIAHRAGPRVYLLVRGRTHQIDVLSAAEAASGGAGAGGGTGALRSPMPGVVSEVKVAVGDKVAAGSEVLVLESMKLFMSLAADVAGTVSEVGCRPGETVQNGQLLLVIEPEPT